MTKLQHHFKFYKRVRFIAVWNMSVTFFTSSLNCPFLWKSKNIWWKVHFWRAWKEKSHVSLIIKEIIFQTCLLDKLIKKKWKRFFFFFFGWKESSHRNRKSPNSLAIKPRIPDALNTSYQKTSKYCWSKVKTRHFLITESYFLAR